MYNIPASSSLFRSSSSGGIALINPIGMIGGFTGPTLMGVLTASTGSVQVGLVAVGVYYRVAGITAAFVRSGRCANRR